MLPDFPEIKKKFSDAANRHLRKLSREDPLLSKIKSVHHFEGNRLSSKPQGGDLEKADYKEISVPATIKREDVITKGPMVFVENIKNIAEELKKQQAKSVLDKLTEITDKTGNVVNAKGLPFSFDLFIKTLEKIWIEFDDQGRPYLPTLVVSPEMGARIKDLLPKWEKNPELKERMDALIDKKREEWNDRESHRKLVD